MCPALEYIGLLASVLGLFLTLATFFTASKVKEKVSQLREAENLHAHRLEIISKPDGYINSIEKDCLYESDSGRTLKPSILLHLTDIETKYTHLSRNTNRSIANARKHLKAHPINWLTIAECLTALKNNIEGEI